MNTSLDTPPVRRYLWGMAIIVYSSSDEDEMYDLGANPWRCHGMFQIKEDDPYSSQPMRSRDWNPNYLARSEEIVPYDTARFWPHP